MLSFLYWLRGRPGETSGVAEQVDALTAMQNLANAQGDEESGKATRAHEKKK